MFCLAAVNTKKNKNLNVVVGDGSGIDELEALKILEEREQGNGAKGENNL